MLVRVEACGVCGTDIKKIEKGLLPRPARSSATRSAGTVARVGARASRGSARAIASSSTTTSPAAAASTARSKAYAQCEVYKRNGTTAGFEPSGGGFAEYVKAMDWIVERGAIPVPDGVLPEEAAFVEPVNTCLKAVRRAGVGEGADRARGGAGADRPAADAALPLGGRGGDRLSDTLPDRLEMSRRLGAAVAPRRPGADVPARGPGA